MLTFVWLSQIYLFIFLPFVLPFMNEHVSWCNLVRHAGITPLRTSFKQTKQSISHHAGHTHNMYPGAAGDCEVPLHCCGKHAS